MSVMNLQHGHTNSLLNIIVTTAIIGMLEHVSQCSVIIYVSTSLSTV